MLTSDTKNAVLSCLLNLSKSELMNLHNIYTSVVYWSYRRAVASMRRLSIYAISTVFLFAALHITQLRAEQPDYTRDVASLYERLLELVTDYPTDVANLDSHFVSYETITNDNLYIADLDLSKVPDQWRARFFSFIAESHNNNAPPKDHNTISCERFGMPTLIHIQQVVASLSEADIPFSREASFLNDLGSIPYNITAVQICNLSYSLPVTDIENDLIKKLLVAIGTSFNAPTDKTITIEEMFEPSLGLIMLNYIPIFFGEGELHLNGAVVASLNAGFMKKNPNSGLIAIEFRAVSYLSTRRSSTRDTP